jgi:hypothetical protein
MAILLFTTAAMLAVSGAVKLRATSRIGMGLAPLALLEMAVALALGFLALPGPLSGSALLRWSVPLALLLLVGSSVDHAVRLRALRRRRTESEQRRLASFVKYLSKTGDTPTDLLSEPFSEPDSQSGSGA